MERPRYSIPGTGSDASFRMRSSIGVNVMLRIRSIALHTACPFHKVHPATRNTGGGRFVGRGECRIAKDTKHGPVCYMRISDRQGGSTPKGAERAHVTGGSRMFGMPTGQDVKRPVACTDDGVRRPSGSRRSSLGRVTPRALTPGSPFQTKGVCGSCGNSRGNLE